MWTHTVVMMQKLRNKIPLDNKKYQLGDRLMTFDAPDHAVEIGRL